MDSDKAVPSYPGAPEPAGLADSRAHRLERELAALLFDLLEKKRASGLIPAVPDRLPLQLKLELFPAGAVEAPPGQLLEQLQRAVDRWVSHSAAFPYGHVYCYWCQSYTCGHSTPPGPRDAFAGYSATGQPDWREFGAILLERRDPRIEQLYRDASSPVTLVQAGHELTGKQLSVYGKHSPVYRLLGQVTLGYLRLPRASRERPCVAVTFQAVELGGERLVLNIVGRLPDGKLAFQALEEEADARLQNNLSASRRNLSDLSLRRFPRRRREGERRRHTMTILNRLAGHLDRVFRQRHRRTRHSEARHLDPKRPAASAFGDALNARAGSIFRDVEEGTWVVIGPKNRVHVFNQEALHVTSVVYSGETVHGRTTRGKWLVPRPDDLAAFQEKLARRARE